VPEVVPLTLHVRPALQLTDDEFFAFCAQNRDVRIEQTKEGDWIIMPPTGFETGSRNSELCRQVGNWAHQDGTGVAVDSSTGFVLPNGAKRSPDAAWVRRDRLAALTPAQKQKFLPLAPDFAAELRSPSDALAAVQEKMAEYLENGTRLGWLLDTQGRRVHVYRADVPVQVLEAPTSLSGDPEMPGFTLDLAPIWTPDV
jgi:Uma2 family endonuclease